MSATSIDSLLAHLPETSSSQPIFNPATGKKIYDLPQLSTLEVQAAFAEARKFQDYWASYPVLERSSALLKLHDKLLDAQEQLLDLLQLETGKSRAHAFEEFAGAVGAARYFAKLAPKALARKSTKPGVPLLTKTYIEQAPKGVVGVITPWNYPLALTMLDVLPALVSGNAVIHKIDNQTALTALFARHLAVEAGIPAAAWTIVVGEGSEIGNAVTDNADYVAFTGSTATGRKVAQRAASRLIGFSLELGGKNPMIVLEGANLKRAAELAVAGAFGSAGQLCVAIERVYVPNHSKADFLKLVGTKTASLAVGRSNDFTIDIGSLGGKPQLDRISGFIDDAVENGATLVAGGHPIPAEGPYFFEPTVFTDVPAAARLARQEVFGPVIAVEGYDTIEEAIEMANDTEYGLNASVVGPKREAMRVASKLMAGSVNINEGFRATFASMESPMGGMKHSGFGRRNGVDGLLRFTESRTVGIASGLLRLPSRSKDYIRMAPLMVTMLKLLRRLP